MAKKQTGRMALAGVFTALAVVFLLFTVSPLATVGLAALAAVCGIPVVVELGRRAGLVHFAAVAVLSAILIPTPEGKGMYIAIFGWYTVFKAFIESKHLPRPAEWGIKLAACTTGVAAYGGVWLWLLHMPLPQWFTLWMLPVAVVAVWVVFVLYDIGISRLVSTYYTVLRPKISHLFRF